MIELEVFSAVSATSRTFQLPFFLLLEASFCRGVILAIYDQHFDTHMKAF